jgi:hypothetical protein
VREFIEGGDAAFADLERRSRGACVRFADRELPPGCVPARAAVGFEAGPQGGVRLLVERGVAHCGASEAVARWLEAGVLGFESFGALRRWLRTELAGAFAGAESARSPDELTDLAAVRQGLRAKPRPVLEPEALERELARSVRGQAAALRVLAGRVCRHVARTAPRRPASVMAIGPTGVGKTRSAEELPGALGRLAAEAGGYGYLRLDMSEYQERHRISQLLGAPQGYVGYGDGAELVDALVASPRTVVLFDEIDKAHPDILRALMNAMDAGRLSSAAAGETGRAVDCSRAVFVFTSNLEAEAIVSELEELGGFEDASVVDRVCRARMRAAGISPELVGRISAFAAFRPLSAEARAEIATLGVARVAEEYGLRVERVAPEVVLAVLAGSQAEGFGTRPDEYWIDEHLGPAFLSAAAAGTGAAVEVRGGPPFECVALRPGSDGEAWVGARGKEDRCTTGGI